MAYTSGFEYDIFISYTHLDNHVPAGAKGWIDQFHDWLESCLARRFGYNQIKIWRDSKLHGSTEFDKVIPTIIYNSAIFFALTSPHYFKSEYCLKELNWFEQYASTSSPGLNVGNERRVFHILLHNVHHSNWPAALSGTSGFPMYDVPKESSEFGEPLDSKEYAFSKQMRKIIDAIEVTIKSFPQSLIPAALAKTEAQIVKIFIADVPDSLVVMRDRIIQDLNEKSVSIIPEIPPPWENDAHEQQVKFVLKNAHLSIHLLDTYAGRKIIDRKTITYPRRQAEIALETRIPQIVWVPKNLNPNDTEDKIQAEFLAELENHPGKERNYEFIRSDYIDFFNHIRLKINQIRPVNGKNGSSKKILLDTHKKDQLFALEVARYLAQAGVDVDFNQEFIDPGASLTNFEKDLEQVHHLIILYGQVAREWVLQRVQKIIQLMAIRMDKIKVEDCWIYLIPPEKNREAFLNLPRLLKIHVIDNCHSMVFDPEKLKPLMDCCQKGRSQ